MIWQTVGKHYTGRFSISQRIHGYYINTTLKSRRGQGLPRRGHLKHGKEITKRLMLQKGHPVFIVCSRSVQIADLNPVFFPLSQRVQYVNQPCLLFSGSQSSVHRAVKYTSTDDEKKKDKMRFPLQSLGSIRKNTTNLIESRSSSSDTKSQNKSCFEDVKFVVRLHQPPRNPFRPAITRCHSSNQIIKA